MGTLKDLPEYTFEKAEKELNACRKDKDYKPLCNNTYLLRLDKSEIAIKHHWTNILTFYRDGRILIDTRGHHSNTTKRRLNACQPYRIGSKKLSGDHYSSWVITVHGTEYIYEDGTEITAEGECSAEPVLSSLIERITEIPSTAKTLPAVIAGLDLKMLERVWKRARGSRKALAKHCRKEFLPIAITYPEEPWRDEGWRNVVCNRLETEEVNNACVSGTVSREALA
jgi:hypothetical protein